MARLSAVVRAPLLLTVGLAACSGGGSDFPISPTGGADAALDAEPPGNASPDAAPLDAAVVAPDAMLDASGPGPDAAPGAELSIAITDAPDPVAASATLTYLINVTNAGALDATGVVVTQRLPPGDVDYQSANGIGWTCTSR